MNLPPVADTPAGFWRRSLAYSLDWLLLAPLLGYLVAPHLLAAWTALRRLNSLLQDWLLAKMLAAPGVLPSPLGLSHELMQDAPALASVNALATQLSQALTVALAIAAVTAALYFIAFEASAWRATPGKRLLGITVVDLAGQRIGWRRAAGRFAAGSLNWLSFNLGHALAAWRPDGRALHDLVAGTATVVHAPMPGWARGLLLAELLLLLGLVAGLLLRLLWLLAQIQEAGLS